MRLTLRTMLAYLDNILGPQEAQQLGEKIKTSEFATKLVQFIRGGLRSGRIDAPAADEAGRFVDANSMAEYLDNTLAEHTVTELERFCLENDQSLVEAAACHKIMTLVVGKPAQVDPKLRQRVYRLSTTGAMGWQASRPTVESSPTAVQNLGAAPAAASVAQPTPAQRDGSRNNGSVGEAVPASDQAPLAAPADDDPWSRDASDVRPQRELPDYMKPAADRRPFLWRPLVAAVALVILMAGLALRALGPFDAQHPVLGFYLAQRDLAQNALNPSTAGGGKGTAGTPANPAKSNPAKSNEQKSDQGDAGPTANQETDREKGRVEPQEAKSGNAANAPDANASDPGHARGQGDAQTEPGLSDDPTITESPEAQPPAPTDEGDSPPADTTDASDPAGTVGPSTADATGAGAVPPGAAARPDVPPAPAAAGANPAMRELGQLRGVDQILARWNETTHDWSRVESRRPVRNGERFFVPPYFRPEIALANGMQLLVVGPAEFSLSYSDADPNVVKLQVQRGRFHIDTVAGILPPLELNLRGRAANLALLSEESSVSLHVRTYLPRGEDVSQRPADVVCEVIAEQGKASLATRDEDLVLQTGKWYRGVNQAKFEPFEHPSLVTSPDWLSPDATPPIERIATRSLEEIVTFDRPLSLVMVEQTENRRAEVQSLAQRTLAELGNYVPLMASFSSPDMHARWAQHFEALRETLALGPDHATALQQALQMNREGAKLYRLAWGFSAQQLTPDVAAALVGDFANDEMAVRVFALENLRLITGKTLSYRPDVAPRDRPGPIGRWKKALENGEIK